MLKIYLVRHGQDQDNVNGILNGRRDMPLTDKGIEQANDLASHIKSIGITFESVFSSPLKRAYKTAEIICEVLGLNAPVAKEKLIERDFGVMTGKPVSDIDKLSEGDLIRTDTITYFLSPEGAETFPELVERAEVILNELKQLDGNILLVTHGDIGKMIYAEYYNLDWKDVLTMFHFGNSDLLELSDDSPADEAHVFKNKQYNN